MGSRGPKQELNEDVVIPLAFAKPGTWRRNLPNALRKKRSVLERVKQCESEMKSARCHRELTHTGLHAAQTQIGDTVHRWTWDDRGRLWKDRWTQQSMGL